MVSFSISFDPFYFPVFGSTITGNNSKNCHFRYSLEEKEFREFKLHSPNLVVGAGDLVCIFSFSTQDVKECLFLEWTVLAI